MPDRRKLTKAERRAVYDKTRGRCAYCGCNLKYEEMQADHLIPLHIGGADTVDNMLPACRSCNHYKSTYTLEKFREQLERMPSVLERDCVTYRIAARFGLVVPVRQKVSFYFEEVAGHGAAAESQ